MPTNDFVFTTDDYDVYSVAGDGISDRPGSPSTELPSMYFPLSNTPKSTMDQDPNNTGPTNDFWTAFPLSIDINGFIFYNGENTGINVRGPAGASNIQWDDLTEEQKASLKGRDGVDGVNGINGQNGRDGKDGLSAYELWLQENGWLDHPEEHPISDFFEYLSSLSNTIVVEGAGEGSIKMNYGGVYNLAGGRGATATGESTTASGDNSFAGGFNTITSNSYQVALGRYNNNKQADIFEIGNGTNNSNRTNVLELKYTGDLYVAGSVTDGNGNILSEKVDKEIGKQLSTNDFNNDYKNFLDNYTVDDVVSSVSENPVQSKAVATAIDNIIGQTSKPSQSAAGGSNTFLPLLHPSDTSDNLLNSALYSNNISWNAYTGSLRTNQNVLNSYENVLAFGQNLTAAANNQIILGKYNVPLATDVFQIGNGTASNTNNLFRITEDGDVITSGDVIDGSGNTLADKQDLLQYDSVPTQNSQKLVKSGDLYAYLLSHGMDPTSGLVIPELTTLQNQITVLQGQISSINTAIRALQSEINIEDEAVLNTKYKLGIYNGELYIKLIEEEQEEEEEEAEE